MVPYAQLRCAPGRAARAGAPIRASVQNVSADQQIGRPFDLQESIESDSHGAAQRLFFPYCSALLGSFALLLALAGSSAWFCYRLRKEQRSSDSVWRWGRHGLTSVDRLHEPGLSAALTGTAHRYLWISFLGRVLARWIDSGLAGFRQSAARGAAARLMYLCCLPAAGSSSSRDSPSERLAFRIT